MVILENSEGRQIARKSVGEFPDMTPAPSPKPEPEQEP